MPNDTRSLAKNSDIYSDVELGDNIYERVGMSLYNALRADPEASVRALVAPDTLPPQKRKRASSLFGSGPDGMESFILNELTNPLVIAGAAMSFRWPILDPTKYRNAAATLRQYERWIPAPLRKLLGLNEVFAGTPIPDIAAKVTAEATNFQHKHFDRVGAGIMKWRQVMGRKETLADMVRIAVQADNTFGPENLKVINKHIRAANKRLSGSSRIPTLTAKDFNLTPVAADRHILEPYRKAMEGVRKDLKDPARVARMTKFSARAHGIVPEVDWLVKSYFPRLPAKNYKAAAHLRQTMIEGLIAGVDAEGTTAMETVKRYGSARVNPRTARMMERKGILLPEVSDLALLPEGTLSDRAKHVLTTLKDRKSLSHYPSTYSLRFPTSVGAYAFSVGRSYAWSYLPHGEKMLAEAKKILDAEVRMGMGLNKSELLRNVYIPGLMGTPTMDQMMKATEWAGVRQAAYRVMQSKSASGEIPEFAHKGMMKMLDEDSFWNPASAGAKISNYFYASTLGLNLASASQNLLQPILTTAPIIGFKNTMAGMSSVIAKIPAYVKMRMSGVSEVDALRKLFPDFLKSGGDLGALSTELALTESMDIAKGGMFGLRSRGAKLREVLLAPFRNSELFNRLSTFEGAKIQGLSQGLARNELLNHATSVVDLTQMWSGGASTPAYLSGWWGPFRQFLTFPSKTAGYALGSITPTMTSAGMELGMGGPFNPGVLGRAMLYSATAYEVAKEVADADISRSLLFGGLPLPQEQAVLSPLPVLPPIVSLSAGAIQDLVTGSTENMQRSMPLLVPGGVQIAKLAQSYVPHLAKLTGRVYADSTKTTPDGRIPMFDGNGKLVGYKTGYELFLSNIGIPGKLLGPDGSVKVQEAERYFLNHRDHIRELRAAYINAHLDGDAKTAEDIQRQYMKDYGGQIEIRPQDWDTASMNRLVPRLERVAKTLPADVRDRFLHVAHTALSGEGQRFLGVDPLMFSHKRKDLASLLYHNQTDQTQGASYE